MKDWLKPFPVLKGKDAEEFLRRKKETEDRVERLRNGTATPEDKAEVKETQDRLWAALRFFGWDKEENNQQIDTK